MRKFNPELRSGRGRISMNWTQLNALLTGVSAIDLGSLAIRTRADAKRFAEEYGFDVDNPVQLEQVEHAHHEAIQFIEEIFLEPDQRSLIAPEIRRPDHVLDLLVYSSNYLNKSNLRQMWACAVLKVMHGIFHIDHDSKLRHFDIIRDQIFEPMTRCIQSQGEHHYLTDGHTCLPLFFYELKRNKGRESILLKLLQKPNYVASDIYDHMGVRLVLDTKIECLFALTLLRKSHVVSVTNIKPFRSRNLLMDVKLAKKAFNQYKPLLARSRTYPRQALRNIDRELENLQVANRDRGNPHSADDYQAIQITARKMVHVPNPAYQQMRQLIAFARKKAVEVPDRMIHDVELDKEFSFYFDFEIQLMDKQSYLRTMRGPASHQAYKKRQRDTARRRVLGPMLIAYLEKARQGLAHV